MRASSDSAPRLLSMDAHWLKLLPEVLRRRFTGRHRLQAMLGNSGWLLADQVIRLGLGLFIGVWIARYLGPSQYGELNYAIAFAALFGALASLGLDGIVVRQLVLYPAERNQILGAAFALKLLGGCVAFALSLAAIWFVRPADDTTFWLVGIIAGGTIFQAFDTVEFWFRSQVQSKYAVYARNLSFLLFAAVKVGLIMGNAGLRAFAWASLGETAVGAIGLLVAYRATGHVPFPLGARWSRMYRLLRESWPLLLSGLAVILYMRLDVVMLREMVGERETGIYVAAARISEICYLLPSVIIASTFPEILRHRESDPGRYIGKLRSLYFVLGWLAVAVSFPFAILSGDIVGMLYGPAFEKAGPVLAVHLWASVAVFLGTASSQHLLAEQLQRISLYRTAIGALVNIALNLVLIPRMGAMGAAVATVASYFAATFSLALFKQTRAHSVILVSALVRRG